MWKIKKSRVEGTELGREIKRLSLKMGDDRDQSETEFSTQEKTTNTKDMSNLKHNLDAPLLLAFGDSNLEWRYEFYYYLIKK